MKGKFRYCSFCGKSENKITYMVAKNRNSKKQINICDECIGLCCEIIFSKVKTPIQNIQKGKLKDE